MHIKNLEETTTIPICSSRHAAPSTASNSKHNGTSSKAVANANANESSASATATTSTSASTADRIDWPRPTILRFIEDYRSLRVLWDANTKGYHMKQTKCEALKMLSLKYGTEIRAIRSKIKSLRSSFHREHGKVLSNRRKGISYQPMWFAYEAIRFILDGSESARSPPSQQDAEVNADADGDADGDAEAETDGDNDYDNRVNGTGRLIIDGSGGAGDDIDTDAENENENKNKNENKGNIVGVVSEHDMHDGDGFGSNFGDAFGAGEPDVETETESDLNAEEKFALLLSDNKYSSAAAAAFAAAAAEMGLEGASAAAAAMTMLSSAAVAAALKFDGSDLIVGEALAYAEKRLKVESTLLPASQTNTAITAVTGNAGVKSSMGKSKSNRHLKHTATSKLNTAISTATKTITSTIRTATQTPTSRAMSTTTTKSPSTAISTSTSPSPSPSVSALAAARAAATNDNCKIEGYSGRCDARGGTTNAETVSVGSGSGFTGAESNIVAETDANDDDDDDDDDDDCVENLVARVGTDTTASTSIATITSTDPASISDGIASLTSSSLATSAAAATVFLNAIAAAGFGRHTNINTLTATSTTTAAEAEAEATPTTTTTLAPLDELTTFRPDFDIDVPSFCNISADDVKTEIIESDSTEAMMLNLDRSNEFRTNFFKSFELQKHQQQHQQQQQQQRQQQQQVYRKLYHQNQESSLSSPSNRKRKHNYQQHQYQQHPQQHQQEHIQRQEEALNIAKLHTNFINSQHQQQQQQQQRAHDLTTHALGYAMTLIPTTDGVGVNGGNTNGTAASTSGASQSLLQRSTNGLASRESNGIGSSSGKPSATSNHPIDEYSVFGEYVAMTIRKMKTSKAKIAIKHLINNLLYEGELGKYDHGIPATTEPPQLYKA